VRGLLRSWPERVSSVIAEVQVERAARRVGGGAMRKARTVLSRIGLIELEQGVMRIAATLEPADLRTLDAIHLASALSIRGELGALCTNDARLAGATTAADIVVTAPA
jgi:uncharacterized protein